MMTFSQRIDQAVNEAGLRASCRILEALEDFYPPRWMVLGLAIFVGHVFLLELKGELSFPNLIISILEGLL